MKVILKISFALACTVGSSQIVQAQTSGATNVYRNQFIDLRAKVQSVFQRTEQQSRRADDYKAKTNLREEILALTKLIHRLEEESLASNVETRKTDKTLLLVSQGCRAMDFVLGALDSYIESDDRAFLGLSRDGDVLIKTVERLL